LRKGHRGGGAFASRTKWRFDMDDGVTLLVTLVMVIVVTGILTTGIHIVKPGEIGFMYRGRKFLRHSGPAFLMGPPIIGKIYRMKAESLHIVFESSSPRMEILLGIADPSRVPITTQDLDSEIKDSTSKAVREVLSRTKSAGSQPDLKTLAEELKLRLDKSLEILGLRVRSIIVGGHSFDYPVNERSVIGIPDWDSLSSKL
jgi:regulator of protease activity HflC (stomatin/prohibitin superfamily)